MPFWIKKKADKKTGVSSSSFLKKRQTLLIGGGIACAVCLLAFVALRHPAPNYKKDTSPVKLVTANNLISPEEVWVDKISKQKKDLEEQVQAVKIQNQFLQDQNTLLVKRLDMMESAIKGRGERSDLKAPKKPGFFPPQDRPILVNSPMRPQKTPSNAPLRLQKEGPRILHLTRGEPVRSLPKTVESYIPAGTYVPAILTSGVVASTSIESQGDPMPIMLRLVDRGTLPRGFQSDLKEAFVIGSCYGDLSSERANCRLHKLTMTERNGEIFESKIEGWIIGEDGRPGIKGDVVDRAGKVAREALTAGIFSGIAGFFKQQATSSSLPSSILGQRKALSTEDVLKGGVSNGASNALEKLADFSIKRAEQMQPVILVSSGRRVDIVFKEGIDLGSTATRQELKLATQGNRLKKAQEGARQASLEGSSSMPGRNF